MVVKMMNKQTNSHPSTASKKGTAPDCHFLKIPQELRDEIYKLALHETKQIEIKFNFQGHPELKLANRDKRSGLLLTNHQIRNEALPVFYSINKFWCTDVEVTEFFFHRLAEQHLRSSLTRTQTFDKHRIVETNYYWIPEATYASRHVFVEAKAKAMVKRWEGKGLDPEAVFLPIRVRWEQLSWGTGWSDEVQRAVWVTLSGLKNYQLEDDCFKKVPKMDSAAES